MSISPLLPIPNQKRYDSRRTLKVHLSNIFTGHIEKFTQDEFGAFFLSALPNAVDDKDAAFLWITQYVAADVDNLSKLGLTIGASYNIGHYPIGVKLTGGETAQVKGPGLLFGVRAKRVLVRRIGSIAKIVLPAVHKTGSAEIVFRAEHSQPLILKIARPTQGEAEFAAAWASDMTMLAFDNEGHSSLTRGFVGRIRLGQGFTRVILVTRGFADPWAVYLLMSPKAADYEVEGYAYGMTLEDVSP